MLPFGESCFEILLHLLVFALCAALDDIFPHPLLVEKSFKWSTDCKEKNSRCSPYNKCCREQGSAECAQAGGMLEYWSCKDEIGDGFNYYCNCVEKYILVDHKMHCNNTLEQTDCTKFVTCCKNVDGGKCATYVGGRLEHPQCLYKKERRHEIDFPEAACRCAVHGKNPEMRSFATLPPARPSVKPRMTTNTTGEDSTKATSTGRKNAEGCVSKIRVLMVVVAIVLGMA